MGCNLIAILWSGRSLGLDTDTVLSGEDLDNLDPKKCKDIINKVSIISCRIT